MDIKEFTRISDAYWLGWDNAQGSLGKDDVSHRSFIGLIRNVLLDEEKADKDLVHCGECAHFIDGFCDVHSAYPTESDFCSWGEKK